MQTLTSKHDPCMQHLAGSDAATWHVSPTHRHNFSCIISTGCWVYCHCLASSFNITPVFPRHPSKSAYSNIFYYLVRPTALLSSQAARPRAEKVMRSCARTGPGNRTDSVWGDAANGLLSRSLGWPAAWHRQAEVVAAENCLLQEQQDHRWSQGNKKTVQVLNSIPHADAWQLTHFDLDVGSCIIL